MTNRDATSARPELPVSSGFVVSLRPAVALLWAGLLVVVLLGVSLFGTSAFSAGQVQPGDPAPLFSLTDLGGETRALTDHSGQVVLLFFFGHNASACQSPGQDIQAGIHSQFAGRGLAVLGIDCWDGSSQQVRQFEEATGAEYPLLLAGSACAAAYDLPYNSFVLIDGRGVVREVHIGPDASAFNLSGLQGSISALLLEASAIEDNTWGAIKALYGR